MSRLLIFFLTLLIGTQAVAEEKEDIKETAASKAAEKKVADKVTGKYKGKKVEIPFA